LATTGQGQALLAALATGFPLMTVLGYQIRLAFEMETAHCPPIAIDVAQLSLLPTQRLCWLGSGSVFPEEMMLGCLNGAVENCHRP